MRYYTFHEGKDYCRIIEAPTSFDARRIVAAVNNRPVTSFFAIRKDLMTSKDWRMYENASNKG